MGLNAQTGASPERACFNAAQFGESDIVSAIKPDDNAFHDQCAQLLQYWRDKDYGAMLRLGLRHMTMVCIGDLSYAQIAAQVAANCPVKTKRENPEKLLRLAYEIYNGGLANEFDALMREIGDMITALPLPEPQKKRLFGEWLIVSAAPVTRDICAVVEKYSQAAQLLQGPSAVIDAADSITLGAHGMPGVYLLRPGMADELRPMIHRLAELFSRLTGETISGLEELYDGALAYYRGDLENARTQTYKAIYLLEKTKQDVLKISAGEQLALIAVHQGDPDCFAEAVEYMDMAAQRGENREACRGLMDLIRCGLFNTLEEYKATPEWLRSFTYASGTYGTGPFGDQNIAGNPHFAPVSYGVACWYHTLYLHASGQHRRAIASAQIMLKRMEADDGALILALYFTLVAGCAHMALGERDAAHELVRKAVALALPDRFFLVLGIFAACFDGMVEKALADNPHALDVVRRVNSRYIGGISALRERYAAQELPESLTCREQDVARLAAKGLRNSEIAMKLGISESTVRAHLRSVFQKLDIDRRAKLAEKLKEKKRL